MARGANVERTSHTGKLSVGGLGNGTLRMVSVSLPWGRLVHLLCHKYVRCKHCDSITH